MKTLQDRPHLISAQFKSVAQLAALTRPKPAPVERSNFERHIYSVDASVTHVLMEATDEGLSVRFDPPNAQAAAQQWREQNAAALSALPDEAIQIDTGRAVNGGDFVQIRIAEEYAHRFTDD